MRTKNLAGALGPSVGAVEPLRARLDDEEFWRKQDERVAAERAEEARQRDLAWRTIRAQQLGDGGAPKRPVTDALAVERPVDLERAAMQAVFEWEGGGLRILSGGTGTGKTTAAVWWLAHCGGSRPAFLRACSVEAAGRYDKATRALWTSASALVLDDLGTEYADSKGNLLSVLDELVDTYHADRRALIITTNLPADAFKERYGERITSRARLDNGWRPVGGRDMRGRR